MHVYSNHLRAKTKSDINSEVAWLFTEVRGQNQFCKRYWYTAKWSLDAGGQLSVLISLYLNQINLNSNWSSANTPDQCVFSSWTMGWDPNGLSTNHDVHS